QALAHLLVRALRAQSVVDVDSHGSTSSQTGKHRSRHASCFPCSSSRANAAEKSTGLALEALSSITWTDAPSSRILPIATPISPPISPANVSSSLTRLLAFFQLRLA